MDPKQNIIILSWKYKQICQELICKWDNSWPIIWRVTTILEYI